MLLCPIQSRRLLKRRPRRLKLPLHIVSKAQTVKRPYRFRIQCNHPIEPANRFVIPSLVIIQLPQPVKIKRTLRMLVRQNLQPRRRRWPVLQLDLRHRQRETVRIAQRRNLLRRQECRRRSRPSFPPENPLRPAKPAVPLAPPASPPSLYSAPVPPSQSHAAAAHLPAPHLVLAAAEPLANVERYLGSPVAAARRSVKTNRRINRVSLQSYATSVQRVVTVLDPALSATSLVGWRAHRASAYKAPVVDRSPESCAGQA